MELANDPSGRVSHEPVQKQETLEFTLDAIPVQVLFVDAQRHIRFANERFTSSRGLIPEQVIGQPVASVFSEAEWSQARPYWEAAFEGEPVWFETVHEGEGVGRQVLETRLVPRHVAGEILGVASFMEDITEQRRLETAFQERERLRDEFLATLAHELRNPLAPIRNAAQILDATGSGDAMVGQARAMIERQVSHLARLVDELLDISRLNRGKITLKREVLPLDVIIGSALETARPLIEERSQTLGVEFGHDDALIEGDSVRLAQVVSNLLLNSAKYTPAGGHITIRTAGGKKEVRLIVEDTGVGIPADLVPRIFEPFVQVEASADLAQGGLGIGLALVQRLVQLHGGTVRAESEGAGKGSRFVVSLPRAVARHAVRAETPVPSALRIPGRRVAIIDDNRDATDSLATLLSISGYDVRVAYDGDAGLQLVNAFQPDAVFLDLKLPGIDGFEVARAIRAMPTLRRCVLIALTGLAGDRARELAEEAGCDLHLVKPISARVLRGLLPIRKPRTRDDATFSTPATSPPRENEERR